MDFDDRRISTNVEGGGGGGGIGGLGGGAGLLLGLVASRFGIGGILVLIVGAMLLGFNPFGGGSPAPQRARGGQSAAEVCGQSQTVYFSCQVLASTEDQWSQIFTQAGLNYRPTTLVVYNRNDTSGCGAALAAMGPFYCPADQRIYIDPTFFTELEQRFGAAGDFAQAYVIAHEVGHHVQAITGVADQVRQLQSRASEAEANALQVMMELQADCYAGVWAAAERAALEPGDVQEGLRAAEAIGDDTLQRATQGYVVPESFTHGTSEQRMEWLMRGLQTGDFDACDTFGGLI